MKLLFAQQMHGFPLWQVGVLSVLRITEPIAFTSFFPYVYFMLTDFGVDELETWRYLSYLAASFAFCQFLFSIPCCALADRYGRKPVLLWGCMGMSVSMLVFGFSRSFAVALVARSLMGTFAVIPVLRTILSEIAVERRHQIAFSIIPLFWNLGAIMGPAIGGNPYLTRPQETTATDWHGYVLKKYPYALSNVFVAVFIWVAVVIGWLFLEETHPEYRKHRDVGIRVGDHIRAWLGFLEESYEDEISEYTPFEVLSDDASIESALQSVRSRNLRRFSSYHQLSVTQSRATDAVLVVTHIEPGAFTWPVIHTIVANFIILFHNLVYWEFIPVLLAGKFTPEYLRFPYEIVGGFGFDSNTIGHLLSYTGIVGVFAVLLLYPLMDQILKPHRSYQLFAAIFPVLYIVLPFLIFTLPEYNAAFPSWFAKLSLYGISALSCIAGSICMPQIFILAHRASPAKHRLYINGVTLSLTSMARCIAPLCWGNVIATAEKHHRSGYSWFLLLVLGVVGVIQSLWLDDYDEDLKDEL